MANIGLKLILVGTIFFVLVPFVSPSTFQVGIFVCSPEWYCSAYNQGSCGFRTCTDINGCGNNYNKPSEYFACPVEPPPPEGPGGPGGGGMGGMPPMALQDDSNLFTVSSDLIKITVSQGALMQRILKINSSYPKNYTLDVLYPSDYDKNVNFITTSQSFKYIERSGDFNIIIDSKDMPLGTYTIPLKVYNSGFSRTVTLVVDVVAKQDIIIEFNLDSQIKNLGVDNSIIVFLNIKNLVLTGNENVIYTILDPKGNLLYMEPVVLESLNVKQVLNFPKTIDEGYYTISARIIHDLGEYVKSSTFSVLPLDSYFPYKETPGEIKKSGSVIDLKNPKAFIPAVVLFAFTLFISYRIGFKRRIYNTEKIKKYASDNKLTILKKSYDKGYISLLDYKHALKEAGFVEESNKLVNQYVENNDVQRHIIVNNTNSVPVKQEIDKKEDKQVLNKIELPIEKKIEYKKEFEKPEKKIEEKHIDVQSNSNIKKEPEKKDVKKSDSIENYSIKNMIIAFQNMPEDVFNERILKKKNSFAQWLSVRINHPELIEDIRLISNKEELLRIMEKYK